MKLFATKADPRTRELPKSVPCPLTRIPIKIEELTNGTTVVMKQFIEKFVTEQEKISAEKAATVSTTASSIPAPTLADMKDEVEAGRKKYEKIPDEDLPPTHKP